MILIILAIALVILFPIWPISFKKFIFFACVVLLFSLVGLIAIRTFIYIFVRIFGYDFYLFPNLFAVNQFKFSNIIDLFFIPSIFILNKQDVSYLDAFKPIIAYEKCDDNKFETLLRFVGFFIMSYAIYILSIERHAV